MAFISQINDPIAMLLGDWSSDLTFGAVVLRIVLAGVLASMIGLERAKKRHTAGMRTFIIVTLSSAAAMLLDQFMGLSIPLLSAASVISLGSISTYSILFSSRSQIKGLTTAVALWACSLLGLAIGCGFYTIACICFVALIFCLDLMPTWENYLKDKSNHFEIHLELSDKKNLPTFVTTARELGLKIDDIESNPAYLNSGLSVFSISLTVVSPELKAFKSHKDIIEALNTIEYVSFVEEI